MESFSLLKEISVLSVQVIHSFFGFALLHYLIGPENSRHFLNQLC